MLHALPAAYRIALGDSIFHCTKHGLSTVDWLVSHPYSQTYYLLAPPGSIHSKGASLPANYRCDYPIYLHSCDQFALPAKCHDKEATLVDARSIADD
jgi:hypothetical protein